MSLFSLKKNYKISFLTLLFAFISACDLTPRLSPEDEEIYTDDLLFYDDQLDLSEYLNPQKPPEITPDLNQIQLKKNPEKVSVIGRKKNTKKNQHSIPEDITQLPWSEEKSDSQEPE